MLEHPNIDPVAFSLGHYDLPILGSLALDVRWYGLMYLIGFVAAWLLGRWRAGREHSAVNREQIADLIFWGALGVILGARFGYMLFYGYENLVADPLSIIRIWEGGMSFHGGFLGVLLVMWLFGRSHKLGFFQIADFVAPLIPIGLGAGRIGNFINGELYGRESDLPWAMSFHQAGIYRHPSQLYEFLLEGVVLFLVLWIYSRKPRPTRAVSGLFVILYGCFRFVVEFFREPDAHIGYLVEGMTMGQLLSLPMVVFGVVLLVLAFWKKQPAGTEAKAGSAE